MRKPSAPRITIRKATEADLPAVQELEQATFTHYAISPRQMRYLQRAATAIFLVAISGGELAGDAIALVRRHAGGRSSGRIYSVVVAANHRGQGLGRKLMEGLLREFQKRGVARIFLEVEAASHGAISLYEKLGFRTIKTLRHYYARGKHGMQMGKF